MGDIEPYTLDPQRSTGDSNRNRNRNRKRSNPMVLLDMSKIKPVGEFGSRPWCEAVALYGAEMLRVADLPSGLNWGFSELYTAPPARLLSEDWSQSGYHFMVKDGLVTGGASVPDECLAISGFHVNMRWGFICHQSGTKYGAAGQKQRGVEEAELIGAISDYLGYQVNFGGWENPVWPQPVIDALSVGIEEGAGLHNIAASLQVTSPDYADLPKTDLGVPFFPSMSDAQKFKFLTLCGILKC